MLLLIDIGNTDTTLALYEDDRVIHVSRLKTDTTISDEDCARILDDFIRKNEAHTPEGAVICSVVPVTTPLFMNAVKGSYGIDPINVDHHVKTGVEFQINNIEGLGADRIATAAAARKLYKGSLIVIDFGTAITFCVITAGNLYKGGAIMPGPGLSADVLNERTAKLPRVELTPPAGVIGKDTPDNIRSGIIYGHAGAAERIIREIKKETGGDATVIATGGYTDLLIPYIKVDYIEKDLIFKGMKIIYEMNSKNR